MDAIKIYLCKLISIQYLYNSIMQKKSLNSLTFFVVIYAFLLSAFALSGYVLNYLNLSLNASNLLVSVLIITALIYLASPVTIPHRPTKTDLLILVISLLASAKFAIFFTSNYPVGSSVDLAHYYFASDWIKTHDNMAFIDYRNAPDYYYLWHTWSAFLWYYGFEIGSAFLSNVFNINILNSMQIIVGISGFVSILCTGLIGYKVLDDWRGGVLTMLQLAAMPATFLLAYNGFFANITALSVGLVLAYISIGRVKRNSLPIIFVLVAGGFLIHIHTMAFMLSSILLYKILSYSRSYKYDFFGYIFTSVLAFVTAYILNPLAFKQLLFESSTSIIIGSGSKGYYIPFDGFENLFGNGIFLVIGIIGAYVLFRERSKINLYPVLWFACFFGAFIFLYLSDKMHWANRFAYILVYPLAISCAALYVKLYDAKHIVLNNYKININNAMMIIIIMTLLLLTLHSEIPRTDLNPALYDIGVELQNIDTNATISYIQYPNTLANPNDFFISSYSRHRIAWPIMYPNNLTYETMKNISYTNDYVPAWHGSTIPYISFENFDIPKYILIMFTWSNKNYTYFFFETNRSSNISCENILSNLKRDNCSINMDFVNDENLMIKSGFYWYDPGVGRWTSGKSEIIIPTIEQKGGILKIISGAFRPEGLGESHVDVYLNDVLIGNFTTGNEYAINTFIIESKFVSKPFSVVTFNTSTWIPDEVIKNGDTREIGIRFSNIEFISN